MKFELPVVLAIVALTAMPLSAQSQRSATAKETKADALKEKLDKGEKVLVHDLEGCCL